MCYHIRWSIEDKLDWECHPTRNAAEEAAKRLVRRGETYSVEERHHPPNYSAVESASES